MARSSSVDAAVLLDRLRVAQPVAPARNIRRASGRIAELELRALLRVEPVVESDSQTRAAANRSCRPRAQRRDLFWRVLCAARAGLSSLHGTVRGGARRGASCIGIS